MWVDWIIWISIIIALTGLLFISLAFTLKRDIRGKSLNLWSRWYHGLLGAFLFLISISLLFQGLIMAGKLAPLYYNLVIIVTFVSVIFLLFSAFALRQSRIYSS